MNPIPLKYSIGSYMFLVFSFKYLKKNILPCDTGAPQWRKEKKRKDAFCQVWFHLAKDLYINP